MLGPPQANPGAVWCVTIPNSIMLHLACVFWGKVSTLHAWEGQELEEAGGSWRQTCIGGPHCPKGQPF